MKPVLAALAFSALALPFFAAGAGHAADRPRAVVELFTSQGCSSCPPADRLFGELAQERDLIVLSLPVTYWDYLGWKDTLASPAFTARQRAYAGQRGDGEVYTPQAVVDGLVHALGSDRSDIEAAAAKASGKHGALSVPVSVAEAGGKVKVSVGAGEAGGSVWLVPVVKSREVKIGRGENSNRSVTYVNVARQLIRLGDYAGKPVTLDLPVGAAHIDGADGYVVLVQAEAGGRPGAILGAAKGPGV